jgi:cell division inhibitor SepF
MGLAQAIRAVVGQFSGAHDDYDDYDDYDDIYRDESLRRVPQAGERAAGSLALVRPPRIEFSLVRPQGFDDAQQISARLRADGPVIVDLQSCGRDLSERLIDFCSGLTYALEGSLEYVGEKVVLLAPHNVELSREASGGLYERRFFNQA